MRNHKPFFRNLGGLMTGYRDLLYYGVKNGDKLKSFLEKRDLYDIRFPYSSKLTWMNMLMQMSPKKYYYNYHFTKSELVAKHHEQLQFATKVLQRVENLNFDDNATYDHLTKRYGLFLSLCLKERNQIIVPTLLEDFVWHSHMTENQSYVSMCKSIFGYILDHRTDIDIESAKAESSKIRNDFLVGLGLSASVVASSILSPNLPTEPKKENRDNKNSSSSSDLSDCGVDFVNFGPLHPLNPLSPMYKSSYPPFDTTTFFHQRSDLSNVSSSSDMSTSSDSSSSLSSSDDSYCGGSSCGSSSCGGGD